MGAVSHRPHARARQHQTQGKPPGQIPSQQRPRANTQEDACECTDSTSAEDTADESSDLTELNTEDREVLEEDERFQTMTWSIVQL